MRRTGAAKPPLAHPTSTHSPPSHTQSHAPLTANETNDPAETYVILTGVPLNPCHQGAVAMGVLHVQQVGVSFGKHNLEVALSVVHLVVVGGVGGGGPWG
jgi:hypothetical protein